MKKRNQLLLAAGALGILALAVYAYRRHRSNRRHARVANEGYETAHDILYPDSKSKGKKLHFGPVIPGNLH